MSSCHGHSDWVSARNGEWSNNRARLIYEHCLLVKAMQIRSTSTFWAKDNLADLWLHV